MEQVPVHPAYQAENPGYQTDMLNVGQMQQMQMGTAGQMGMMGGEMRQTSMMNMDERQVPGESLSCLSSDPLVDR